MVNMVVGSDLEGQSTYSIGLYADMDGYSMILIETTNRFVNGQKSRLLQDIKTEIFQYRAIAGLTGDRDEVSFKNICLGMEVLIGNCKSIPTVFVNKVDVLETLLLKQMFNATFKFVEFNIESMVMVVICLANDGLLRFDNSGEVNLFVQYSKALKDYAAVKDVNHQIYALGLALSDFIPGNANWISGLSAIEMNML